MAILGVKEIRLAAKELLAKRPSGMRYMQRVSEIARANPETSENTIHTQVGNLPKDCPGEVIKPSRGVYQLAAATPMTLEQGITQLAVSESAAEADFYSSFAAYLRD